MRDRNLAVDCENVGYALATCDFYQARAALVRCLLNLDRDRAGKGVVEEWTYQEILARAG